MFLDFFRSMAAKSNMKAVQLADNRCLPDGPSDGAISIFTDGYGHSSSVVSKMCIDKSGNPLPWYTYPAMEYIRHLDLAEKTVFEFGLGNSSLFWSSLTKKTYSVDSDPEWFTLVAKQKRSNMNIYLHELKEKYTECIAQTATKKYDIIVIDGVHRLDCAKASVLHLSDDGFIVLDNSDWFLESTKFLSEQDLLQVDFHGLGPINNYAWTTSIFFRRSFKALYKEGKNPGYGIGSIEQVATEID